jgi:hypothetical protein
MRTHKLPLISALSLVLGFAATGCAKDDGEGDTNSAESTGTATDDPTATASATVSASGNSASATDTDTASTATETDATTDSGPSTVSVTDTATTGDPEPQPNGSMCDTNEECVSAMCFVVGPLGGICGDCLTDADCAATTGGGCSIPNPLAQPPEGAACNMGEPGAGCMSDDVCAEGVCAEILNVPGILVASTCSECIMDSDCADGGLCSPSYDVANLTGIKTCVQPGMVPDGTGCDLEGTGNEACENGHCVGADVLGVLELGVCSACAVDTDCADGETCTPPAVDLEAGLVAGVCTPPA